MAIYVEDCEKKTVKDAINGLDSDFVVYLKEKCGEESYFDIVSTSTLNGVKRELKQRVNFDSTNCNYGGSRLWFKCSDCNKRVGVLYGHKTKLGFYCRNCLKLSYKKSHFYRDGMSKIGLLFKKLEKLEEKMNKKGTHMRTKASLYKEHETIRVKLDEYVKAPLESYDRFYSRMKAKITSYKNKIIL